MPHAETPADPRADEALLAEALGQPWYHTIELRPGVFSDGTVDHRSMAPVLLPGDLRGLDCLDVGTFDGYWAFTMEERGAARVAAIDLERFDQAEWPPRNRPRLLAEGGDAEPGVRFKLAHRLRDSRVERVLTPIYEISPERTGGTFDRIVLSDLLLHVRDPIGALEAVRTVLRPGGRLLVAEEISVRLSVVSPRRPAARLQTGYTDYGWWQANVAGLREWLHQAGYRIVSRAFYTLDAKGAMAVPHVAFEAEPDPSLG
ncbi:class I SAM-dependent methyltransferase [Patulibacter defluvii]|uniref:class I SAM-dependent methyltransferase n=1 Tax=Patulibacter defluvii TaxID=3095358 RepID=UPI002A75D9D9|nr:methyltransferase domain-containing protein [Patulibacter sp. DM4]